MTQPSHIFIVGTGRSGTTVMRQCLNMHPRVALSGETYFLGSLVLPGYRRKFSRVGDVSTEAGARQVVDYLYDGIRDPSFWRWIQRNIPREQFLRDVLESDRTDRALFDVSMRSFTVDGQVPGDKSPGHVFHVPTLLKWYPEARIVHMLRDPRAVFVSKKAKISRGDFHALPYRLFAGTGLRLDTILLPDVLIHWLRVVRLHHRYQRIYRDSYRIVRFEDLIGHPETCLRDLCEFLQLDYVDSMLRTTSTNSSFLPPGTRIEGLDASSVKRWRSHLTPMINRLFMVCCRKQLVELGYEM